MGTFRGILFAFFLLSACARGSGSPPLRGGQLARLSGRAGAVVGGALRPRVPLCGGYGLAFYETLGNHFHGGRLGTPALAGQALPDSLAALALLQHVRLVL